MKFASSSPEGTRLSPTDLRRTQLARTHPPTGETYHRQQAALADSYLTLYKGGNIESEKGIREDLVRNISALGDHQFAALRDPHEYHSPRSLKTAVFHVESSYLAAFRLSLQGAPPEAIAEHARNLRELYGWSHQQDALAESDRLAFSRLNKHFEYLVDRMELFLRTEDPPTARAHITELLSEFFDSYVISNLLAENFLV